MHKSRSVQRRLAVQRQEPRRKRVHTTKYQRAPNEIDKYIAELQKDWKDDKDLPE